jgi:hypothetical protein
VTLNTQSGAGCNRWGWYVPLTLSSLPFSGPLYVGAGGNDISKATNVGSWIARLVDGKVVVTYNFVAPYTAAEVHVDLACLPIEKCAPGQYGFGSTFAGDGVGSYSTPGLAWPSCGAGGKVYLIVHAKVSVATLGSCGAVVAT